MSKRERASKQNPIYPPPRCPAAEVQGGINLKAIFPLPGDGIQLLVVTPDEAVEGDTALVYWGSEDNLVGVLPLHPDVGHANPITVNGAMARLFTPENTRNPAVEAWYVVQLSQFGDEFPSQHLSVNVDFQPPGGLVPPEHQASVNPALGRIPELDLPIPPGQPLTLHVPNWAFQAADDRLYLRWGSHVIGPIQGQVGAPVPITVPWDIISGIDGGRAIVDYYIVDTVGNDSRYSQGQQVIDLPKPDIPETNGTPFLDGGLTSARLIVPKSASLLTGDLVEGFFAGKSVGSRPATPQQDMEFPIPGAEIAASQGTQVDVHYVVRRGGVTYSSAILQVAVTRPTAPEWDLIYDFDSDRIRYVNPYRTIVFPEAGTEVMNMQFDPAVPIPASEQLGVEKYPFPGTETEDFMGNVLYIGDPQYVSHNNTFFVNFAENWNVVRFAVTSVHRQITISFKDAALNIISPIFSIPDGDPTRQTEIRFDDGGRRRIRHVEIRTYDVVRFDSFKFKR